MLDTLAAAGVPYITVPGNHDGDNKDTPRCERTFTDYNAYFGVGRMSAGFSETGVHEENWPCSSLASGLAEQGAASYHVLTQADGAQWLFIALPWLPVVYSTDANTPYSGMTPQTLAWAKAVIEAHPKMPTVLIAHHMITSASGCDPEDTAREDIWCNETNSDEEWWTGMPVYDHLMPYAQVFMTIGGHIRELFVATSSNTTYRVMGGAVDYTDPITGAPAWQNPNASINGGGGVVTMWRVDPVLGVISSKAYSDEESDWVNVYGVSGSNWTVQMPLCDDDTRFSFPAAACPQRPASPQACCQ
jgi:hypothetical protein